MKGFYALTLVMMICIIANASSLKSPTIVLSSTNGIINFNNVKKFYGWDKILNYDKIYRWGLSSGVHIEKDAPPVVDNLASYITKNQSSINFENLDRYKDYSIYIDFVKYKGKSRNINSRLKIYADNNLIDEIRWGELSNFNYYYLKIPRKYNYDGKIKFDFVEIDSVGGFWGIWDVIISSDGLPKIKKVEKEKNIRPKKFIDENIKKFRKDVPAEKKSDGLNVKEPLTPKDPIDPDLKN